MRRLVPVLLFLAILFEVGCARNAQYYLDRGKKLAAQGKNAEAELNFRKAIQKDGNFGEAYYQLALTYINLRRATEAYQTFANAVRLLPNREDVSVKFADFCWLLYRSDPRQPQTLFDKVNTIADQLLAKNAKSFDGLRLKGNLAASSKRYAEAENDYRAANDVKPLQPELILAWAGTLFLDGKPADAEALSYQIITKNKTYLPIYDLLYVHYMQGKDLPNAEKVLKTKIANNPNHAGSVLELAAFYHSASREADMKSTLEQLVNNPKQFPQGRLQVGDVYSRLGRWNEALAEYNAGAAADSGNRKERLVYLKRITDVWIAQGKPEQAEKEVDEILKEEPGEAAATGVKASLLLTKASTDNAGKAVALLQPVVEKNPENANLHFTLGRALAIKGDRDGARAQFLTAIQKNRNYIEPRLALIELSQAKGDYAGVLQYANDVLAINPNLGSVRLIRAVSLLNTGSDVMGRKELADLEKAFPQNREVLLQTAILDLRDKKYKEAEERFRLLAQNTKDVRPLTGLVQTLAAESQLDKALKYLQDELKKSPQNNQVRYLLGLVAVSAGKPDLAIEQYQQLLHAAPNSAQVYMALGSTYRLKKDIPTALSNFQKASELAPKDPGPLVAMADTLQAAGRKPDALAAYRKALQLKPENPVILNNTAYLIAETGGNVDEALKLVQKAVQLDSKQPRFTDTLGWVYLKKNLPDSALQAFRGLTRQYPDDPVFHYHFGMALLQKGDRATARSEFKSALTKKPSDEVKQDVEAALAKIG